MAVGSGLNKTRLTDANAQSMLINNVIIPLAQRYSGNNGIWAIQLVNEMNSEWLFSYEFTSH